MIKTKWLTLPLLIGLVVLPRVSIDFYLPSLPFIGKDLQSDDAFLQLTLTIFMLGYALSMLIAGPLSDLIGRKKVLVYGLSLYVLATFVCALANTVTVLIVARFFQALGGCCGTVIARVMVKDAYSKEEQITILAELSAAMAICPLVIPLFGGILQTFLGWQAIFYALAIFALFLLFTSRVQINPDFRKNYFSFKSLMRNYQVLLTSRLFIGYSCTIGFAWCNYFVFTLSSSFLLQKTLGFSAIFFGIFLAIVVCGYLTGTVLVKKFASTYGSDKLIIMAIACCLLGSLVLLTINMFLPLHWYTVVLPMAFIMIGVGIIIPCTQAAVMQPFPNIAGTASGLFFFIQMLFGSVCGLLLQFFQSNILWSMILTIVISSLMLFMVFYTLIWRLQDERLSLAQIFTKKAYLE